MDQYGCCTEDGLIRLAGNTWLLPGPTNIGLVCDGHDVVAVDSGNDKEAGRRLLKILRGRTWSLRGIINTHSNADHAGANSYLQTQTGCPVWASPAEAAFMEIPELEGSFLWGGFPPSGLDGKFFRIKPCRVDRLDPAALPDLPAGITLEPLPGHFFGMIGVRTADGVLFAGDALFGSDILEKYSIPFIYDVGAFLSSLERLGTMDAGIIVPSHGPVLHDPAPLIDQNVRAVHDIRTVVLELLETEQNFESLLAGIAGRFGIQLNLAQYALIGSTLRSFLSWLHSHGYIGFRFSDNTMLWQVTPEDPVGV